MHKHMTHMWVCGAMIAAGIVAVAITGNAAILLPAAGCVLMMGAMMWMMMGGMGGRGGGSDRS